MSTTPDPLYEYPVRLDSHHKVGQANAYEGDQFMCAWQGAYTHTGAWPTWRWCPYCGIQLPDVEPQ